MGEILSVLKVIITSIAISLSSEHKGPFTCTHMLESQQYVMPRRRVLALAHAEALPRLRAPASARSPITHCSVFILVRAMPQYMLARLGKRNKLVCRWRDAEIDAPNALCRCERQHKRPSTSGRKSEEEEEGEKESH